jgi:TonB family protein
MKRCVLYVIDVLVRRAVGSPHFWQVRRFLPRPQRRRPSDLPNRSRVGALDHPAQGTGESTQHVRAAWQKELIAHFNQHKRFPLSGSLDCAEILVTFVLDEDGRVLSSIVQGSGDASFDEAALTMIRPSDLVPKPTSTGGAAGAELYPARNLRETIN